MHVNRQPFDLRSLRAEQFADAGPSPTREDAYATVVHNGDSAAFNLKHGARHLARALKEVRKLPDGDMRDVIDWNLQHALKHHIEAREDVSKMVKHVRSHPAFRQEAGLVRDAELGFGRAGT